jgi:hypothetical protein
MRLEDERDGMLCVVEREIPMAELIRFELFCGSTLWMEFQELESALLETKEDSDQNKNKKRKEIK